MCWNRSHYLYTFLSGGHNNPLKWLVFYWAAKTLLYVHKKDFFFPFCYESSILTTTSTTHCFMTVADDLCTGRTVSEEGGRHISSVSSPSQLDSRTRREKWKEERIDWKIQRHLHQLSGLSSSSARVMETDGVNVSTLMLSRSALFGLMKSVYGS